MRTTRRRFIQTSALATAGLWLGGNGKVYAFNQSPLLRKFVQPLPMFGTDIPLASPNTKLYTSQIGGQTVPVDFYRIVMGQYSQSMHPDLPKPTTLWGYADATSGLPKFRYLGGTIVATKDRPVRINAINLLPPVHPLPVDTSLPGAETGQWQNRTAIHLHGGFVPWMSDGGPFHWFTPFGTHGPSLVKWLPNEFGLKTDDYWYPNQQSARLMWYHDHALGITRLNAYAGLAAGYILIDPFEQDGVNHGLIPDLVGIPLVLQEKSFKRVPDQWGLPGDLWYPKTYEGPPLPSTDLTGNFVPGSGTGRWDRPSAADFSGMKPLPRTSCIPEFFGDSVVINGAVSPFVQVPARRVRFRLLNGTQARMWNLSIWKATGDGMERSDVRGPAIVQFGTEAGFLPAPAVFKHYHKDIAFDANGNALNYNLLLGGAERADIVVDFAGCEGQTFVFYNDAPAPFPGGDPRNDYYTGAPDFTPWGGAPAITNPRRGPNTRVVLQIRVVEDGKTELSFESWLSDLTRWLAGVWRQLDQHEEHGAPRPINKTLNEDFDEYGRLIQMLGTDVSTGNNTMGSPTFSRPYQAAVDPSDHMPDEGETQTWDIYNTTGDTHPIHFHLVNVKIIGRAPFAQDSQTDLPLNGVFEQSGPFRSPDDNEKGYKETVRMNPGEITRVVMKFDLPQMPTQINKRFPVHVPTSPRTGGHEYVWHCHILEHEEHDMMRPLVVTPKP